MLALERSEHRIYPLPALYNFRSAAIFGSSGPDSPVVVQVKVFENKKLDVNKYKDVALHAAMVIMEDCLNAMKQVILRNHYLFTVGVVLNFKYRS